MDTLRPSKEEFPNNQSEAIEVLEGSRPLKQKLYPRTQFNEALGAFEMTISPADRAEEAAPASPRHIEVQLLGRQAASLAIIEACQQPPEESNLEIPDNIVLGEE